MSDPLVALVDLDAYPMHRPGSPDHDALVERCRAAFRRDGVVELPGFIRPEVLDTVIAPVRALIEHDSFLHRRRHNIYFLPTVDGLAGDHPALRPLETVNRTVCADQLAASPLVAIYEWPALRRFLAAVIDTGELHLMDDPLGRLNVMSYRAGEALNWHFDRSVFTTTLLLQQPDGGGVFEFRPDLRADDDPNYDGVGALLAGNDGGVRRLRSDPGTLTVFAGKNTAHRVSPVEGGRDRIVAVLSYYERAGVAMSTEDRLGFYGRA